ncbi:MAG: 3-hydroxyacyl-CoA dehydrogenase NAD-binding domain-containing protein [Gammaproteobacteria bacterium]|nr:3-hydroxyacyl-CoA dehydrogenase NAD-binding domain-containing protein [Gammaproteobacteria bacterium]
MSEKEKVKNHHWQRIDDDYGIVWLSLDKADATTNVLSYEVLNEFEALLKQLQTESPQGLVIQSKKENGFIAGADVNAFKELKTYDEALELIQHGQAVFNRLERLNIPTLALIHGFCLGGGLELALACDYRIADENPKTKLGLPEVLLGIHPGFGGSVRLTRLVGAPAAMSMMLSGRAVRARAAKKMGLLDAAVPQRQLQRAAHQFIMKSPKVSHASGWKMLTNYSPVRQLLASVLRRKVAKRARPEHYPAPYALIDLWEQYGCDKRLMMREEAASVARLIIGKTAQNLVRVFFLQEQLKSQGKKSLFTPKYIHIIGGGVMGGDIAAWCALCGLRVTIQDRQHESLARVIQRAHRLFRKRLKQPRLITEALERLRPDKEGLGLSRADVVIEAIFEDVEAKQLLFREIEPQLKEGALLATNTSSIPLEVLGEALAKPERLVGLHFFNPVAKMQLVEIVSGELTDPEVAAQAAALTRHINRLPLPVKSSPGFLVNRVLMPYLLEAVVLESEGVAPEVIDEAALDFGMPMGPVELADTVGLDICYSVAGILSKQLQLEVPNRLAELVKAGHLGRKTGQGFYQYKKGKVQKKHFKANDVTIKEVQDRLIKRLLDEAHICLQEGIVKDADQLDAGIIFGTGFAPFRGGPIFYTQQRHN